MSMRAKRPGSAVMAAALVATLAGAGCTQTHRAHVIGTNVMSDDDAVIAQALAYDADRNMGPTDGAGPATSDDIAYADGAIVPGGPDTAEMKIGRPAPVSHPYIPEGRAQFRRQMAALLKRSPVQDAAFAVENTRYRLDTGDQLRVFVYGQPSLSRVYTVDDVGTIQVPLINQVRARGRTPRQVKGAIAWSLAQGFVKDPQVTVEVAQYRPYFVMGEVVNAGGYPFGLGLTVRESIALAGGHSPRAEKRFVKLTRTAEGLRDTYEVTLDEPVQPGDTITVPERWF